MIFYYFNDIFNLIKYNMNDFNDMFNELADINCPLLVSLNEDNDFQEIYDIINSNNHICIYKTDQNVICINTIYKTFYYISSLVSCYCNPLYEWSCHWCLFDNGYTSINYDIFNKSFYFSLYRNHEYIDLHYTPFYIYKEINYNSIHDISEIDNNYWKLCNNDDIVYEFDHMNVWYMNNNIMCMNYNNDLLYTTFEHNNCTNDCMLCKFKNKEVYFDANPFSFTKSRWIYF